MPGVVITNISTNATQYGLVEVDIELSCDSTQTDLNAIIARLRDVMSPQNQAGYAMTASTTNNPFIGVVMIDEPEAVPLPDEDSNGNGVFDANEELRQMIEKRFDEVDQALRLLVDP
jgi:hypothetical protein